MIKVTLILQVDDVPRVVVSEPNRDLSHITVWIRDRLYKTGAGRSSSIYSSEVSTLLFTMYSEESWELTCIDTKGRHWKTVHMRPPRTPEVGSTLSRFKREEPI